MRKRTTYSLKRLFKAKNLYLYSALFSILVQSFAPVFSYGYVYAQENSELPAELIEATEVTGQDAGAEDTDTTEDNSSNSGDAESTDLETEGSEIAEKPEENVTEEESADSPAIIMENTDDFGTVTDSPVDTVVPEPENESENTTEEVQQGEILGEGLADYRPVEDDAEIHEAKEKIKDLECSTENKSVSEDSDWIVDQDAETAVTSENVELGVTYVFPLEEEVSVTFTCLPAVEENRSSLTIQRVKVSSLDLQGGVYPASEYAYDITTDMENGDFEFNLTLPADSAEQNTVSYNYIEKDPEERISNEDIVVMDNDKAYYDSKVEIKSLDHFTIFIKTYSDLTFSVESSKFAQGSNVNVKSTGLTNSSSNYYALSINPTGNGDSDRVYITSCQRNISMLADTYTLAINAAIGTDWEAGLHAFSSRGDCTGSDPAENDPTISALFEVYAPQVTWPNEWEAPGSCVYDPKNDERPSAVDLYGVSGKPAVGFYSDTNYFYFRERVDGDPIQNDAFVQNAWVVVFQVSGSQYQYLASLNGKDDMVQLYKNTSPAGVVDFDPLLNDPAETLLWEGPAQIYATSSEDGSGDYFVDWALPKDLLNALGLTENTTKFYATSANANNFNKDHLNCYDSFADISVTKTDSADPVYAGQPLNYTIEVTNNGPDTAEGVVLKDDLPTGYAVVSVTPSKGTCSDVTAPDIVCELGDLASNQTVTVVIIGTAPGEDGKITNKVSAYCDSTACTDTNLANNVYTEETTVERRFATLVAHKIVCDSESDLPNWGEGGPDITSTTAEDYIAEHEGCRFVSGWDFQWSYDGVGNPGDNTGEDTGGNWYTFGPTNINGMTLVEIEDLRQDDKLWVREVWSDRYIPFTFGLSDYTNRDSVSAELYCHIDVLNYDNWDEVNYPEYGETYYCIGFNVAKTASISVVKDVPHFEDQTQFDFNFGETKFSLTEFDSPYVVDGLAVGETYTISEAPVQGYATSYTCTNQDSKVVAQGIGNTVEITPEAGDAISCKFRNTKNAVTLVAHKIICENESDLPNWGEGGPAITSTTAEDYVAEHEGCRLVSGWDFQWSYDGIGNPGDNSGEDTGGDWYTFGPTDENGMTQVEIYDLKGDDKLWVREVWAEEFIRFSYGDNGFTNADDYSAEIYCHIDVLNYDNWDEVNFPEYGETYYCVAFNVLAEQQEQAFLEITKENNAAGPIQHGGSVLYTIYLTLTGANLENVVVTDLLPHGFDFNNETWNVTSSTRGLLAVAQPTYASPGDWNIGDMFAGETLTLKYSAKISTDVDPGIYKDMVWATGKTSNGISVLAAAGTLGFVADNFSGTSVEVTEDPEVKAEVTEVEVEVEDDEGDVLGAYTELPATGLDTNWLLSLLAMSLIGALLIMKGRQDSKELKKSVEGKKSLKKMAKIIAMLLFALVTSGMVVAASTVVVRVEDPESMVTAPFNITFVTMDTEGREITAKCYKQGPSDAGYVQFGSDISISAGGNTANCYVGNSVLTEEGTYKFKVEVAAGADSDSDETSTYYDAKGPAKPKYIEKDKKNSCKYEVTVRTADDGETAYVEVYRDDDMIIEVSDASRVQTISMGPDEKKSFTDELSGDCDTPYYAVRAFDSNGNPSSVRTEEVEKEVMVSKDDSGKSAGSGLATSGQSGAILIEEGVSQVGNESGTASGTESDTDEGEVLGTQEDQSDDDAGDEPGSEMPLARRLAGKWWVWLIAIVVVTMIGNALRKRQNASK